MGISVSAGTAVILVGIFLMLGVIVPGTLNAYDRVATANEERESLQLDRAQTDIAIESVTVDNGTIDIEVENTGRTTLHLSDTSVLINNTYTPINMTAVNGTNQETNLWLPEETATFTVLSNDPGHVIVVTEYGVRDRVSVEAE